MKYPVVISTFLVMSTMVAGAETRIFHLMHRPAADIVDTVRAALGNDARVSAADHSLFVNASPAELSVVAEVIGVLDRSPAMLRVSVDQQRHSATDGGDVAISGGVSAGAGSIVTGRTDPSRHGWIYGEHDGLQIGMSSSHSLEHRRAEQFLVTLEGRPARISVGRRIPFAERWLLLAHRHAHVVETLRYESVDTGFEVQPELVGDQVQMVVRPFMAFQDPQQPCEIVFHELSATARVPLGEWYDLGGTMAPHDEVSREILAGGHKSGKGSGIVRIKVELQPN